MITGFNTDIEFEGVTYHIQTEDKGLSSPVILSLVYDRGTILASKRAPYDDLIQSGFDEKTLTERLRKQHKTICAAVKKGRIGELGNHSAKKENGLADRGRQKVEKPHAVESISVDNGGRSRRKTNLSETNGPPADAIPMPIGAPVFEPKAADRSLEPVIDDVIIFDEVIPVEAVQIVSDLAGTERPENTKLSVEFIGDVDFRGGRNCNVSVMVCRGSQRKVIEGAEVMVKVLGSSFRPLIFHSQSDRNGLSNIKVNLPNFSTGRASVMVRAISLGEEVEIRRPIAHS